MFRKSGLILLLVLAGSSLLAQQRPNIVLIYADDLGYGDLSCYGARRLRTPHLDHLAARGLRFTNAHATSATCTPSRFSLLTGRYAWRRQGTGIAPGDAALLIPTNMLTMPRLLQQAGYVTGVVGKWHLGLGPQGGPDWNGEIRPGPLEIGFNYAFLMPATGDRVPCVYVENHRIVNLDPADPIAVSYTKPVGNLPTGKDHPELLTMRYAHGHDQTIVNGVSRIGYMSGGRKALWNDQELAQVLTDRAAAFMESNRQKPFFLYFATHDIHVPRLPHSRFAGKSGMGPRGDALLQLDYTVGQLMETLERLGLDKNTLVIFSSDNGPVLNDGYVDGAVEQLGGHTPAGPLRGGKYSAFEAGTRVPLLVHWPGRLMPGVSNALVSQIDLMASLASLTGQPLPAAEAGDSRDALGQLLGHSRQDREFVVGHAMNGTLSLLQGRYKYIEPSTGPARNANTNTELGNLPQPQLYDLRADPGETRNLAHTEPVLLGKMEALLRHIRQNSDRPTPP